jgi:hypothetical protein
MRMILPLVALLAACSQESAPTGVSPGLFAGEGRDALCIAGEPGNQRAGFIAYGDGETNCSARGRIEVEGGGFALVPQGEGDCRIPLTQSQTGVTLGKAPASCSYYCGPGAGFEGKSFRRASPGDEGAARTNPMVDFAGDPLC